MLKPKGCETMDNEKSTMGLTTERKPGGLYRNVKISVKTADRLILVGIVVLIACVVFAISHAGFTVTFDTNGGSQIENQKVMHGQLVNVENDPVKEGYTRVLPDGKLTKYYGEKYSKWSELYPKIKE